MCPSRKQLRNSRIRSKVCSFSSIPRGVSQNGKLSYKGKDVTLEDALDGMFKKNGLGYVIISNKKDAYDGAILVKPSKDRGTILTNR